MPEENSPEQEDPLQKLYVRKNNRQLLSDLLVDYIGIDRDTLEPVFKPDYENLSEKQKILLYLLYRRALMVMNHIQKEEIGQPPKKIAEATGINYNSVRGYLSQLNPFLENKKSREGYYIPPHKLSAIREKLPE